LDTPLAKREVDMEYYSKDEAARALQELYNGTRAAESPNRAGAKRSRPQSIDNSLQENVREMLNGHYQSESSWSDDLVRSRAGRTVEVSPTQVAAIRSSSSASLGRKRVCCSTEATRGLPTSNLHPAFGGLGGVGMWEGILN